MTQLLTKTTDQRIVLRGTWEKFKLMQQVSEDSPGVRLAFYNGEIEIFMPGREHEVFGSIIGGLLLIYLAQKGIFFQPTGSMTQEKEGTASAQADQSFCIGSVKPIPDLSIEVVFTSGGESKLELYRVLNVPEVWFWQDGVLRLHHLRESGYERIERSELPGLEDLNIDLLKRCILMSETDPGEAVRTFQQGIL
ncbi:MAG: Uma2 family endonuclease [Myxacorys californica WJT36-NPBG1]|jgi:Uma2 family endonuclease|nr:Uma2 family endonuclease [Myxacorys californica WJT36-NPBG1]